MLVVVVSVGTRAAFLMHPRVEYDRIQGCELKLMKPILKEKINMQSTK
jgi:hypothetical protein